MFDTLPLTTDKFRLYQELGSLEKSEATPIHLNNSVKPSKVSKDWEYLNTFWGTKNLQDEGLNCQPIQPVTQPIKTKQLDFEDTFELNKMASHMSMRQLNCEIHKPLTNVALKEMHFNNQVYWSNVMSKHFPFKTNVTVWHPLMSTVHTNQNLNSCGWSGVATDLFQWTVEGRQLSLSGMFYPLMTSAQGIQQVSNRYSKLTQYTTAIQPLEILNDLKDPFSELPPATSSGVSVTNCLPK